jgi:hypothetical protein
MPERRSKSGQNMRTAQDSLAEHNNADDDSPRIDAKRSREIDKSINENGHAPHHYSSRISRL